MTRISEPEIIDVADPARLVEKARAEHWLALVVLGPGVELGEDELKGAERVYQLESVEDLSSSLKSLHPGGIVLALSEQRQSWRPGCNDRIESRLKRLDLKGDGDLSALLPEEVLSSYDDPESILAAYRRLKGSNTHAFNEAKLLVVGNEAVGLASLLRYLIEGEPRDPAKRAQAFHP